MIPATIDTSSSSDTCLAAIAARTIGKACKINSKTLSRAEKAGILLRAKIKAIEIKAGKADTMIPRIFILFKGFTELSFSPLEDPPPKLGRYLISQNFAKEEIKEIALVRLVVPVVPEVEITFAPWE